jgi:hypothetical protein
MAISQALIRRLSKERFEAYRLEGESDELALARHCWNTALSEALYPVVRLSARPAMRWAASVMPSFSKNFVDSVLAAHGERCDC